MLQITKDGAALIAVPSEEASTIELMSPGSYHDRGKFLIRISPCSKVLLATPAPHCMPLGMKQWRLMLNQKSCERMRLKYRQAEISKFSQPTIDWYAGAPLACIFAMLTHWNAIHIRCGAQAKPLARLPVPSHGEGAVCNLIWSPDGHNLAYATFFLALDHFVIFNFDSDRE